MLRYAVVFLSMALLLGLFGSWGAPSRSDGLAQVLSLVFLALAVSSGVIGWFRRGRAP